MLTRSDLLEFLAHRQRRAVVLDRCARSGIDVGVGKGLDLVVLDERRVPCTSCRGSADRLGELIDELAPDVDRDRLAAGAGTQRGGSRLTERDARGVRHPVLQHPRGRDARARRSILRVDGGRLPACSSGRAGRVPAVRGRRPPRDGDGGVPARAARPSWRGASRRGDPRRRRGERGASGAGRPDRRARRRTGSTPALCAPDRSACARRASASHPGDPQEGVIVLPGGHAPRAPVSGVRRGASRRPRRRCSASAAVRRSRLPRADAGGVRARSRREAQVHAVASRPRRARTPSRS